MATRPAALADYFYPGDAATLLREVDEHMSAAKERATAAESPKAIVAPHAGLVFSGPVAGSAYALLAPARDVVERVVILGPAHRVFVRGLCAPEADAFATPLGEVRVDREALESLRDLPQVVFGDAPHAQEHSLEVQLPFIQRVLGDVAIVPLVVGDASAEEVAEVLEMLWGGEETRIVISSDLSHFHDYETARKLDEATSEAIVSLDERGLHEESACGRVPLRGLLHAARQRGMEARMLDLRSSGDTAGTRDRVVGYGAYAFA